MCPAFDPSPPKKPGDLVLSQDWNNAMGEIVRLEDEKVDRTNPEHMTDSLIVDGNVGVGTSNLIDKLHVVGDQIRLQSDDEEAREIVLRVGGSAVALRTNTSHLYIRSFKSEGTDHHVFINPSEDEGFVGIGTKSPEEKLHVQGNILMAGDEDLYAMGAPANLKAIAGHVNKNGTIKTGDGFIVERTSAGKYTVTFQPPFNDAPVVIGTVASDNDHIITVYDISADSFNIRIRDMSLTQFQNSEFTFMALGVR